LWQLPSEAKRATAEAEQEQGGLRAKTVVFADTNATSTDDVVPNMGCRHHNLKKYAMLQYRFM